MNPASASVRHQILAVARENLNFSSLRPGQEEPIRALLAGKDFIVVMRTGASKSAIYQIAGLMMGGVVLVVSPLIALQKHQVDSINSQLPAGSPEALAVESSQSVSETREAFSKIERGDGKFVFLAPEQLRKPETLEALQSAGITLIVIDEAHCISEWGHEFSSRLPPVRLRRRAPRPSRRSRHDRYRIPESSQGNRRAPVHA